MSRSLLHDRAHRGPAQRAEIVPSAMTAVKPTAIVATCMCTSTIMLRGGVLVCAACSGPIVATVADGETYSSNDLPPGVSRRTYRETCASGAVAGAARDGQVWRCSRAAWEAARARRPARAPAPAVQLQAHDDVDAWIDAAGLRSTRRAG